MTIFIKQNNLFIKESGHVVKCGRFFVPSRIWPSMGYFRGFWRPGGTSYHLCAESVLNRKCQENNLFRGEM